MLWPRAEGNPTGCGKLLDRLHPNGIRCGPLSTPPFGGSSMARSTQKTSTDRPNLTAAAPATTPKRNRYGLPWKRYFTRPGVAPFDEVQWETREAAITNEKGEVVFEQHDVEIPTTWSQVATNVVVSSTSVGCS